MKLIQLRGEDREQLAAWAHAAYPREACGLLVGTHSAAAVTVAEVVLGRNLAAEPDRFTLDPADWLATHEHARRRRLQIVGHWHSHPDADAVPSARDHAGAQREQACVIVAVGERRPPTIRCYDFDGASFHRRELTP